MSNPLSLLQPLQSFLFRGLKIGVPVAATLGAVADLASTIAPLSLYLCIVFAVAALITGLLWITGQRRKLALAMQDGTISSEERKHLAERHPCARLFAFSTIAALVMGGFLLAAKIWGKEDKGLLATLSPALEKIQQSLFRVEKKVDAIAEKTDKISRQSDAIEKGVQDQLQATEDLRANTNKIVSKMDEIADKFAGLSNSGGLIENPQTPEAYYHNARMHELNGNMAGARQSYLQYLGQGLDFLDPWLSYSNLLKMQDGRESAIETLRQLTQPERKPTLSAQIALALLLDREPRIAALEKLQTANATHAPIAYLLSREFSLEKLGKQAIDDLQSEKKWLALYRQLSGEGHFLKHFLDKKLAEKWSAEADASWAALAANPMIDQPVAISTMNSNSGMMINIQPASMQLKEIRYRVDAQGEFISTGHMLNQNPQTGLPMPMMSVTLPAITGGQHAIEIVLVDPEGRENGPHKMEFNVADEMVKQAKLMLNLNPAWAMFRDYDGKVLVYFTAMLTVRPGLKSIHYSLDSDKVDQEFKFEPSDKMYEVPDNVYFPVTAETKSISIKITFKDGTESDVKTIVRQP